MYQALSRFTVLQATGSWAGAWERGYTISAILSQANRPIQLTLTRQLETFVIEVQYVWSKRRGRSFGTEQAQNLKVYSALCTHSYTDAA